ncbi:ABC transporter ATP-binding protein [Arachidicoccus terrestris]|uniref:ABC transporter ATP-binding protein n=1 Tax=Arachidicoccus terrestris TaxID=2875539 RepID=UPI001CC62637|nr:ATP-binding cassette domain-containing protein [Arachidicoccus terrestris]UAY56727.1 ATP-binding cassette domain-containing protein [Arachidicoccus terrestris]
MNDIFINGLRFKYPKEKHILNGLNMHVKKGAIYGFIGANGAGKSTTIRLILGLLKGHCDEIEVLGENPNASGSKLINNIGFLIDKPVFYNHLTCEENLRLLCKYYNLKTKSIQISLERVGLFDSRKTMYRNCSTGMKQRLAIAKAIVHKPKLLILDEPFNGMDPEWIVQIRLCLQEINSEGVTIFYSSHLLAEMEKLVTDIGIIKNGTMIIENSIKNIVASDSDKIKVRIHVDDAVNIENIELVPGQIELINKPKGNCLLFEISERRHLNKLILNIINHSLIITDIEVIKPNLESFFLNYIA